MTPNVLAVLLAATVLAAADTGEFLVDIEVAYTSARHDQQAPAAASDGTNSLIVWRDTRRGDADIYGARLTPEGAVLDPAGIAISTSAAAQTTPAVACDGANYLVVWADGRGTDTSDIYAARVTADGYVLDSAGIPVSSAVDFQGEPAVAFDGANFLVVWTDLRNGNADIYGTRVSLDGTVLDTSGLALVTDSAAQTGPAACCDGSNVLLVWEDTRNTAFGDIYGARVSALGEMLDSGGFVICAAASWQGRPATALGDTNILVVWHDARSSQFTDVYGARVTRQGAVLDTAGIGIATSDNYQWYPKVAFDRTNYLVAWQDEHGHGLIYAGRVGLDGTVLDQQGFPVGGAEDMASPQVVFDGTHSTVVWNDARTGPANVNVYGARVDSSANVLDPGGIMISAAATSQERPAAAFDGTEYLVVWSETREAGKDIRGVRLTPGGTVLDSPSVRVSRAGDYCAYPAMAYSTGIFLAAWEEGLGGNRDVRAARVSSGGQVLDSAGILISGPTGAQCAPAVAGDSAGFLVAWQDWRNSSYDIYCARVSQTGTVLDTAGVAVCTSSGDQVTPAVAYNGTDYLVLWQHQEAGVRDIYGARVNRQGVVLDPDGFIVSAAAGAQEQPAAASDGDDFLVVWSDWRNAERDIFGSRVTGTGTVPDTAGIQVCAAPGSQSSPAVAHDGTNFLIVWEDQRSGKQDLYGALVTPLGVTLDTFVLATEPEDKSDPALAHGWGSRMLLAYTGWTEVVGGKPYNSPRIWATLSPVDAMEEEQSAAAPAARPAATIVRNVLFLPMTSGSKAPGWLLDAAGRKVLALRPGTNDVCSLTPGVYYLKGHPASEGGRPALTIVRKLIVAR